MKDRLLTIPVQLEQNSAASDRRAGTGCGQVASGNGEAVKVPFSVLNHAGGGASPVGASGEGIQGTFLASSIDFEHDPATGPECSCYSASADVTTTMRGAVKVTRAITKQVHGWSGSVRSSLETVKNGLVAVPIQLEHHSAASSLATTEVAAEESGAIEAACGALDHAPYGILPVCTGKCVQHGINRRLLGWRFNSYREKHARKRQRAAYSSPGSAGSATVISSFVRHLSSLSFRECFWP